MALIVSHSILSPHSALPVLQLPAMLLPSLIPSCTVHFVDVSQSVCAFRIVPTPRSLVPTPVQCSAVQSVMMSLLCGACLATAAEDHASLRASLARSPALQSTKDQVSPSPR